jgi:hypothetical protein
MLGMYIPELHGPSSRPSLEHVHDRAYEAVAVLDEFAITGKVECLEKETKAGLDKNLVSVEAEREAESSLVKQLYDLHNVFTGIADCDQRRRSLVADVGNNSWAIDQSANVVVRKGLGDVSMSTTQ